MIEKQTKQQKRTHVH